jgi:hypothetical protein
VKVAYGQAYHHRAQWRVENAGQQLIRKLRGLLADLTEEGMSWVELLPRALRCIHDTPGQSGFTPYEIAFGRQRPLAGLPYAPEREAEGASQFMDRMAELDVLVASRLNALHERQMGALNATRKDPPPLVVGSKVWYRPERQPGTDKLAPWWVGPGTVQERTSEHGYVVEISPGVLQAAHRTQLKPHVADTYSGTPYPLHYFAGKAPDLPTTSTEWLVDDGGILDHRRNSKGEYEFLVRWKDWDPTDTWWEPWIHFFPGANEELVQYCRKKKIPLCVVPPKPTRERQVLSDEESRG